MSDSANSKNDANALQDALIDLYLHVKLRSNQDVRPSSGYQLKFR